MMNPLRALSREAVGSVERTVDCLKSGGVVLLPTDTVFGLAACPDISEAVSKIFQLKARPAQKNLPMPFRHLKL